MRASVWFVFFGGALWCRNLWYIGGRCDNKEGGLNWEHMFPRVLGYKRRSDIIECDITDVKVYVLYRMDSMICRMDY